MDMTIDHSADFQMSLKGRPMSGVGRNRLRIEADQQFATVEVHGQARARPQSAAVMPNAVRSRNNRVMTNPLFH